LSFAGVLLFIANVISGRRAIDRTIMLLVVGGALLSLEALYEWRTHDNLFDRLDTWVPILHKDPSEVIPPLRGGMTRARASAQHPIAFGAALVMLLPLALYLYQRTRQKLWMGIAGIVVLGALVTISRTAATMLGAELVTFLVLKRRETVRMLPMLLPLILCAQVAIPGTLGTFRAILFPSQGLVAEEQQGEGTGTGRLKDVPMALEQFSRKPLFGQGFGTRFTDSTEKLHNAQILDDQWLSSLLEIGAVGVAGLMWMLFRSVRRLGRRAKRLEGDDGWLMASLAASLVAFGVGMLTFDAFSFIQATFIFYILVGLSAAVIHMTEDRRLAAARRAAPRQAAAPAGA
jgi:O-antigen ligase